MAFKDRVQVGFRSSYGAMNGHALNQMWMDEIVALNQMWMNEIVVNITRSVCQLSFWENRVT